MRHIIPLVSGSILVALLAVGCASEGGGNMFDDAYSAVTKQFGRNEDVDKAIDVAKSGNTVLVKANALDPIGPREEYFIGRAVAANVIDRYGVVDDPAAVAYVNLVGQSIALRSDEPTTYGGYKFIILDTDEVNGLAAPGGFVMISRGLLARCAGEDALAGVLAHEIVHVQERHGIDVIQGARGRDFMATLGREVAKNMDDRNVNELGAMLDDVVNEYLVTLLDRGYDRKLEYAADAGAVELLVNAGYDPAGLRDVLAALDDTADDAGGWSRTHPRPSKRVAKLGSSSDGGTVSPGRQQRFDDAMASVLR